MFSLHKSNTKGVGFNKIIRRVHKNWYFKDVTWVKNLKWAHHCFFKKICPKTKLSKKNIKFAFEIYTYFQGGTESWGPPSFFFFFEFVKITQFTQPHSLLFLFNVAPTMKFSFRPPCLLHCPSLTSSRIFYIWFLRKFPRRHYFSFFLLSLHLLRLLPIIPI